MLNLLTLLGELVWLSDRLLKLFRKSFQTPLMVSFQSQKDSLFLLLRW